MNKAKGLLLGLLVVIGVSKNAFAERILFLGDSHVVGAFGQRLDELLRSNPEDQVQTYGVCGSVAQDFFLGSETKCGYYFHQNGQAPEMPLTHAAPLVKEVLNSFRPDTVIIELGTNYAPGAQWTFNAIVSDAKPLADLVIQNGAKCFWVSMPDTRTFRARIPDILSATRAATSSGCKFIDSTKMIAYPENVGGGVHYNTPETIPLAKSWAEQVYSVIQKN